MVAALTVRVSCVSLTIVATVPCTCPTAPGTAAPETITSPTASSASGPSKFVPTPLTVMLAFENDAVPLSARFQVVFALQFPDATRFQVSPAAAMT